MSATLFREHWRNICFVSGAGRNGKNRFLSWKCPQAESVCKQKSTFLLVEKGTTPTNHKIMWNSGKMWEVRRQKSDSSSDGDCSCEFWELRDLWHIVWLECLVSVLCSVCCSVFSVLWSRFLCCESKQQGDCWIWSRQEGAQGDLSLMHCLHLNVNSYI